jgi:hypothetical protein
MAKVTNLTLHKNTVEKRQKRERAKGLCREAERMVREADLRAYAVVGIDANGEAHAVWDTGAIMPMWAFPAVIGRVLEMDIARNQELEDWVPPLKK